MQVSLTMAMTTMRADLTAADVSRRQLDGVQAWRAYVDDTIRAAAACGSRAGTTVEFTDSRTHRSWLHLCEEILRALSAQEARAQAIRSAADSDARNADTPADRTAAEARARKATAWARSAAAAGAYGRRFIDSEDAITRPVAEAIAAVGGLAEVAKDKNYHQGARR